jgi:archaellum component FlaF (FlaF/FlaG flagellin family)
MNTSITSRAAALVASILITFGIVYMVADYAYPEAPATRLASAAP